MDCKPSYNSHNGVRKSYGKYRKFKHYQWSKPIFGQLDEHNTPTDHYEIERSMHEFDSTIMSRIHSKRDSKVTFNGMICNNTNTLLWFMFTRIWAS